MLDELQDDAEGANISFDFDASMTACGQSDTDADDFFGSEDVESTAVEEAEVWERKISDAIDQGTGLIDLRYVCSRDLVPL